MVGIVLVFWAFAKFGAVSVLRMVGVVSTCGWGCRFGVWWFCVCILVVCLQRLGGLVLLIMVRLPAVLVVGLGLPLCVLVQCSFLGVGGFAARVLVGGRVLVGCWLLVSMVRLWVGLVLVLLLCCWFLGLCIAVWFVWFGFRFGGLFI